MRAKGYQNYFEEEVLAASPLRLIELLYRGALDSIASARRYLKLGDIRARSSAINKAMEILTELTLSLNPEAAGELSGNLSDLYGYVQKLLIEANVKQADAPLAESERLLSTLLDAWVSCAGAGTPPEDRRNAPSPPRPEYQPLSCAY